MYQYKQTANKLLCTQSYDTAANNNWPSATKLLRIPACCPETTTPHSWGFQTGANIFFFPITLVLETVQQTGSTSATTPYLKQPPQKTNSKVTQKKF